MNGSTLTFIDPRTVGLDVDLGGLGRETDSLYRDESSLSVSPFARYLEELAARLLGGDSVLRGLSCSSSTSTLNSSSHCQQYPKGRAVSPLEPIPGLLARTA